MKKWKKMVSGYLSVSTFSRPIPQAEEFKSAVCTVCNRWGVCSRFASESDDHRNGAPGTTATAGRLTAKRRLRLHSVGHATSMCMCCRKDCCDGDVDGDEKHWTSENSYTYWCLRNRRWPEVQLGRRDYNWTKNWEIRLNWFSPWFSSWHFVPVGRRAPVHHRTLKRWQFPRIWGRRRPCSWYSSIAHPPRLDIFPPNATTVIALSLATAQSYRTHFHFSDDVGNRELATLVALRVTCRERIGWLTALYTFDQIYK